MNNRTFIFLLVQLLASLTTIDAQVLKKGKMTYGLISVRLIDTTDSPEIYEIYKDAIEQEVEIQFDSIHTFIELKIDSVTTQTTFSKNNQIKTYEINCVYDYHTNNAETNIEIGPKTNLLEHYATNSKHYIHKVEENQKIQGLDCTRYVVESMDYGITEYWVSKQIPKFVLDNKKKSPLEELKDFIVQRKFTFYGHEVVVGIKKFESEIDAPKFSHLLQITNAYQDSINSIIEVPKSSIKIPKEKQAKNLILKKLINDQLIRENSLGDNWRYKEYSVLDILKDADLRISRLSAKDALAVIDKYGLGDDLWDNFKPALLEHGDSNWRLIPDALKIHHLNKLMDSPEDLNHILENLKKAGYQFRNEERLKDQIDKKSIGIERIIKELDIIYPIPDKDLIQTESDIISEYNDFFKSIQVFENIDIEVKGIEKSDIIIFVNGQQYNCSLSRMIDENLLPNQFSPKENSFHFNLEEFIFQIAADNKLPISITRFKLTSSIYNVHQEKIDFINKTMPDLNLLKKAEFYAISDKELLHNIILKNDTINKVFHEANLLNEAFTMDYYMVIPSIMKEKYKDLVLNNSFKLKLDTNKMAERYNEVRNILFTGNTILLNHLISAHYMIENEYAIARCKESGSLEECWPEIYTFLNGKFKVSDFKISERDPSVLLFNYKGKTIIAENREDKFLKKVCQLMRDDELLKYRIIEMNSSYYLFEKKFIQEVISIEETLRSYWGLD